MIGFLWLSAVWFRNDFGHYMDVLWSSIGMEMSPKHLLPMPISLMNSAYAEICKHEYSQVLQIPCEEPFKHPKPLLEHQGPGTVRSSKADNFLNWSTPLYSRRLQKTINHAYSSAIKKLLLIKIATCNRPWNTRWSNNNHTKWHNTTSNLIILAVWPSKLEWYTFLMTSESGLMPW